MEKDKIKMLLNPSNKDYNIKKIKQLAGYYDDTNLKEFKEDKIYDNDLTKLANHYNSDKGNNFGCSHNYTKIYEEIFEEHKNKNNNGYKINLFEIGVACGSSLKMWASYFKDSKITGIDINPKCKDFCENFDNIEIIIGDVLNHEIKEEYDIIIDDGSHLADDIIQTFYKLYPLLKKDGIYVIEDLQACKNEIYVRSHFKYKSRKYSNDQDKFMEMNSRPKIDEFYRYLDKHKFNYKKNSNSDSEVCFIYK